MCACVCVCVYMCVCVCNTLLLKVLTDLARGDNPPPAGLARHPSKFPKRRRGPSIAERDTTQQRKCSKEIHSQTKRKKMTTRREKKKGKTDTTVTHTHTCTHTPTVTYTHTHTHLLVRCIDHAENVVEGPRNDPSQDNVVHALHRERLAGPRLTCTGDVERSVKSQRSKATNDRAHVRGIRCM